jgi:Lon protease-like protein
VGPGAAAQAFTAVVRLSGERLSIFPLHGVILFPGLQLPLHVFEPRYRELVGHALAKDRRIAMIQPQSAREGAPLFAMGCVGRIEDVEALEDGRYNIVLEGLARFRLLRELEVSTPFRQVEGELIDDPEFEALSAVERASFEREARDFADRQGYSVDWGSVAQLDDLRSRGQAGPARSRRHRHALRAAGPADAVLRPERSRRGAGHAAVASGEAGDEAAAQPVDHVLRRERRQ